MNLQVKVEIPMGSTYKYEFCTSTGVFILDRVLNQKIPYNYGYFIYSQTQPDGDQLDVFICSQYPIPQGTECTVKIVGGFKCLDQGVEDNKIVAVLEGEDIYVNEHSIQQYLSTYKQGFEVLGDLTKEEIRRMINPTLNEHVLDCFKDYDWNKFESTRDKTSGELKTEKAYEQIALTQEINKKIEEMGLGLKGNKNDFSDG